MADDAESQAANDAIRQAAEASREGEKKPDDKPEIKPSEDDIETIAAQADKPDAVRAAIKAERDAAKEARDEAAALAAKVKEYEDRDKSEQEKLEERASSAEQKAATLEAKLLRRDVAAEKGLPPELADRLRGDDKDELEEDADRLLELVKARAKPSGDVGAGRGEGGEGHSFNDVLRAGLH